MPSKIGWCTKTINPIIGCSKYSPGCDNCYAERMARRLSKIPATEARYRHVIGPMGWTGVIDLDIKQFSKLSKTKKPQRIFLDSMGDFFHPNAPIEFQKLIFGYINIYHEHTFIILTKRARLMRERMDEIVSSKDWPIFNRGNSKTIQNLWLGVTAEDQEQARLRVPDLLATPAAGKRIVSIEPILGPIDLQRIPSGIDWVICGPENGPKKRAFNPNWIISLSLQCSLEGIPFWAKDKAKSIVNIQEVPEE